MKKILIIASVLFFLCTTISFAEGDKNQGDEGQGTVTVTRDPAPFPWPGIDWSLLYKVIFG